MENISQSKLKVIRDDHDDKDAFVWFDQPLVNLINLLATNITCGNFRILPKHYHQVSSINKHTNFDVTSDDIDNAIEAVANFCQDSTMRLEWKFMAMDDDYLLVMFLYYHFAGRIFNVPFESYSKTVELCKSIYETSDKMIYTKLAYIHETFTLKPNYTISIKDIEIPWNDRILPRLSREQNRSKRTFSQAFGCSSSMINSMPTLAHESLFSSFEQKELIRKYATIFGRGYTSKDSKELETDLNNMDPGVLDRFLNHTKFTAVKINGTACAGKTTILNNTLADIQTTIDCNAEILKIGSMGGFAGKDYNQVLAMEYQYVAIGMADKFYTSVCDRCPFNNMIWRIILSMMDTTQDMVSVFMKELADISPLMIKLMSNEPIIVIIATDVQTNRDIMARRNNGGDVYRSRIENYTKAQNIVYGVLAKLCNWILVDTSSNNFREKQNKIQELLVKKTERNVWYHHNKTPNLKPSEFHIKHKLIQTYNIDHSDKFNVAKDIHIFK